MTQGGPPPLKFEANGRRFRVDLPGFEQVLVATTIGSISAGDGQRGSRSLRLTSNDGRARFRISSLEHGRGVISLTAADKPYAKVEVHFTATPLSIFLDWADSIVFALLAFFILRAFVAETFVIPSGSMEPTFKPSDRVLALKSIYWLRLPYRGEIIIFRWPKDESKDFVKRVIGLPGDRVEVRERKVYVNGHPLKEPYEAEEPRDPFGPTEVPQGSLFVMGDNRNNSYDSRRWGFVPLKNLVGKPFLQFWPLSRLRVVQGYAQPLTDAGS